MNGKGGGGDATAMEEEEGFLGRLKWPLMAAPCPDSDFDACLV